MRHDSWSVDCVGSFAHVSLWQLGCRIDFSTEHLGRYQGVIGNDAVIVARELCAAGVKTRCYLLDPTDADVDAVSSVLRSNAVVAIGGHQGQLSHSLCFEDEAGVRNWIFSRLPQPSTELGEMDGDMIYVDYYPEFREYFRQELPRLRNCRTRLIVNLSAVFGIEQIPLLPIEPFVVQASVPRNLTPREAREFAMEVLSATHARRAFVTMGSHGAVLAASGETWYSSAVVQADGRILGAGAVFSSQVILGVSDGLDRHELVESAVSQTALRLQSSRME